MIDTHSHPYLPNFPEGGAAVVDRAVAAGVGHIIMPNVDADTIATMMALHQERRDVTSVAMGLHPTEVKDDWEGVVDRMRRLIAEGGFVAVGEVGIDLYWDKTREREQREAFAAQLRIAREFRLPVIIHCREALDATLETIKGADVDVPLIFHSFTGSREDVRKIREVCDPYFGINGVVTFKNAQELREALPEIGLDRILLETDSPYLAPVPFRGKRNESAYLGHVCRMVASTLGIGEEEVERVTDSNAVKVFSLVK
ncbi:MAG: TatD family hydrolase [Muribaculaceae bacterium]|nr:TatD family hydrolase [Muribaculaceae bacterium]